MTSPARTAAYNALRAIAGDRADLPTALARSRQHLRDDRDRALAAEIVTGTLRWQRSIDHLAVHFARRPLAKLDPDIVLILRLSLYQLLHLDRVPASAVVDDAVDLARAARKPSATGFVNAVLRSTLREKHKLPLPARPAEGDRAAALDYLGITHSHPDWLVARWLDRYGLEAAERWVRFNNDTPALTLRANRLETTRDALAAALTEKGVDTVPTRYAPEGLSVTAGNPLREPSAGMFFVQDEASQLVPLLVDARPGERVLDLCASPGGKTTAMAADMEGNGLGVRGQGVGGRGGIIACDVRERRVRLLRDTVKASGARQIQVVQVSSAGELPFAPEFDRVLVDAPCSGLGTIRRDPDIRWKRNESDLAPLASRQRTLLGRAAEVVKSGGRLVYATCSSEPEENEHVIEAFLAGHPSFQLVDLRAEESRVPRELFDGSGMLRTLPSEHGLEAFFAAALVRRSG
jgi:16S rRNA (cytosine967-C5)-methyltransferase